MRRHPISQVALSLAALSSAFLLGLAAHRVWPREALAQTSPSPATIYVPAEGLVFRAADGKAIAKLSREPGGGVFELYDDNQETVARLSAAAVVAPPIPAPAMLRPQRPPYVLDDEDPFARRF